MMMYIYIYHYHYYYYYHRCFCSIPSRDDSDGRSEVSWQQAFLPWCHHGDPPPCRVTLVGGVVDGNGWRM